MTGVTQQTERARIDCRSAPSKAKGIGRVAFGLKKNVVPEPVDGMNVWLGWTERKMDEKKP